jgi:phthiocerol/phenolphthiocerol synthesis type-I polyketide synthase E
MSHRRIVVCRDVPEAVRLLEMKEPERVWSCQEEAEGRSVVFMFPGGGAQYVNMGLGLYRSENIFREEVDRCSEILRREGGWDLREYLYPGEGREEEARRVMRRTSVGLPALFAVEYAMAKQLEWWGIRAEGMIGHSLGEYVAACLGGVFSLEDALKIVKVRGELFEELPKGGMVSVAAGEEEVRRMMGGGLSIAAVNGPEQVVVSGEEEAVARICERMKAEGIEHQRVQIEVAAHSEEVEVILERYEECVRGVKREEPKRRFISNVSGKWVKEEEAKDAGYWRRQLRESVRFSEGVRELVEGGAKVMVEVGPGQGLRSLVKMQKKGERVEWVVGTMRHPQKEQDDREYLAMEMGKLWMAGVEMDWGKYYEGERRRRVRLPTYPFERQRYWIDAERSIERNGRSKARGKREDVREWFYLPGWQRRKLRGNTDRAETLQDRKRNYVVMEGNSSLSRKLIERLKTETAEVIRVRAGKGYRRIGRHEYEIRVGEKRDYQELVKDVLSGGTEDVQIVHVWSMSGEEDRREAESPEERFRREQQRGFYSLLYLAQAIEAGGIGGVVRVSHVSRGLQEVESGDEVEAEQATVLGACKVISQECESVKCKSIDVGKVTGDGPEALLIEQLVAEIESGDGELEVAYRGGWRYVRRYEPVVVDKQGIDTVLKPEGVYLITGGTGGIGIEVAEYLCQRTRGKVVLVSRSGLNGLNEDNAARIERMGGAITVERADVANQKEMREVVARVERRLGRINGLIHAAGLAGQNAVRLIPEVSPLDCEMHFRAKVYGLYVLAGIVRDHKPDFCLLFSSNASVFGGLGLTCYSAANIFMDTLACRLSQTTETRWISANWDGWLLDQNERLGASFQTSLDRYAMTRHEAIEALEYVLSPGMEGQVVVATGDLTNRLAIWTGQGSGGSGAGSSDAASTSVLHARPSLATTYVAASDEIEQVIVNIWQEILGIDRLGIHDNFFDLGGNSLVGLKAISRLKKELSIDLPIIALFEGPTVSALAKVISKGKTEGSANQESRSRGERRRERLRLKA